MKSKQVLLNFVFPELVIVNVSFHALVSLEGFQGNSEVINRLVEGDRKVPGSNMWYVVLLCGHIGLA